MKVILRAQVVGLGKRGDTVTVSDGYARNFLIPKGLALLSHPGAIAQAEVMRKSREERDARERAAAEEIARRLAPVPINLVARASGGKLFGSISASDIAEAVYEQTGLELDRKRIDVSDPIREVGHHLVPARLHDDVQIFLQVEVAEA